MEDRLEPPKMKVSLYNEGKARVNNDVSWSYDLVFACFPLSSFCFLSCFHAFPVMFSVGFLSAVVSSVDLVLLFPIFFLLHLHFVKLLLFLL